MLAELLETFPSVTLLFFPTIVVDINDVVITLGDDESMTDGTVNVGIAVIVVVVVGGGNWETETDMDLIRLTVDDVSPCWGKDFRLFKLSLRCR